VAVLRHPVNLAALSPRAVAKLLFATPPTA
jgi:hypothetical protein